MLIELPASILRASPSEIGAALHLRQAAPDHRFAGNANPALCPPIAMNPAYSDLSLLPPRRLMRKH
jgi:hypothetical protein